MTTVNQLLQGRSYEFKQWLNLDTWATLPTIDQLDQIECAWTYIEDSDFLTLRIQEIMHEVTLRDVLFGQWFRVDGVDGFRFIESYEDYDMMLEAAQQLGDWVAGFIQVEDGYHYITAAFDGTICDHVLVPEGVDISDFDPYTEGVDYPL